MSKIRWGVLGVANIATQKVIPAMQQGKLCSVEAIASRSLEKAQAAAKQLGISKAYGSYEELLADPDIDAVYNPLPNHLHVPWSIRALEAGKHVLCEKPLALSAAEAQTLVEAGRRHPQLKLMEAFMYRHHPQWQTARRIVREGVIGSLRTVNMVFSYFKDDPTNIRNMASVGGGGMMDIGCYPISAARWLFDAEPQRVFGCVEFDPELKVDRLASAVLDFGSGTATFTVSTQLVPFQRFHAFGTSGYVEIEIPCNAPPDKPCRLWHADGQQIQELTMEVSDQYTLQGDLMSQAILENTPVPTPIEDGVANMRVIEAVFASGNSGCWQAL